MSEEDLSKMANCFGEVVDDEKLNKMDKYMGRPKTRADRAQEAWNSMSEDGKDTNAIRYVEGLKAIYGDGQSTLCLVYNATGDTLRKEDNHDWYGYIGPSVPYPAVIGNGQWAAFHHVHRTGEPSGSVGAVVYRGRNKEGEFKDYLVAWSTPWGPWYRNKAYCEIGAVGAFKNLWGGLYNVVANSNYSSNARSVGCEMEASIETGDSPKFTVRISCR
ncbi:23 kDa jasmonate-induced protein [Lolium perenne]|uniref:23 kDa jasmonate-induced protein-like n=1 Tax=Lolium perenne TaxID=4522 RepID=UPI0021F5D5AD|nr:23 kDa jasmonate-induced protein-like [Lolium perenne]